MAEFPAHSSGHQSVRPSVPDDVIVGVRLRPQTLAMLREGMAVLHLRLDVVPDPGTAAAGGTYDLYVETQQDIDAVPAWDAPHSAAFLAAADRELMDFLDG